MCVFGLYGVEDGLYIYGSGDVKINGNIECSTINNISTDDISLNTHNYDDKYAVIDHTHSEYSLTTHNHDDKYSP